MFGGDGADSLTGGTSNDVLTGGTGADRLAGGAGLDQFVFDKGDQGLEYRCHHDFSAADDTILLDDAVFAGLAPGALLIGAFNNRQSGERE